MMRLFQPRLFLCVLAFAGKCYAQNSSGMPTTSYIGIGTATPAYPLHVKKQEGFHINLESTGSFSGISMHSSTTTKKFGLYYGTDGAGQSNTNSIRFAKYATSGDAWGAGWETTPVAFDLDAPNSSFVLDESGYVGLGIGNPTARLDIDGGAKMKLLELNSGTSDGARLVFYSEGYPDWRIRNFNGLSFFNGEGQPATMVLANDGKVGIGTQYPQATLSVNGDIFSKKVKVTQSGWADFVFDPGYKLMPLEELEAFISKRKHLPDVPSEVEIENEGNDLGETQRILLMKIEELTLYVIQQNKEMEVLRKEVESLKKSAN